MANKPPDQGAIEPWTQQQLTLLHEMVVEYERAQWFKKQLWKWLVWILGLPALALTVWEPIVRLWKLFRSGLG